MLVALLVCLIPTTIGGLLSAIGIAGMDRLVQRNVLAMSGRAVEAAGDCSTLLLDKTGTITLGNRQAAEFLPVAGVDARSELAEAALLASLADETPEGRSIVVLAKERYGLRERERRRRHAGALHRPDPHERRRPRRARRCARAPPTRSGAGSPTRAARSPDELGVLVEGVATGGGTPLVVSPTGRPVARRHPPQGRGEAGHAPSASTSCGPWASAR